jgi:uncharacterized protein
MEHSTSQPSARPMGTNFANLEGHNFMNLTTFRKTGVPVTSPVWFAEAGGKLYVVTDRSSGKVKRLRNNPAVEVGPSMANGKSLGPSVTATARLLPEDAAQDGYRHLQKKYGWQLRAFELMWRFRRIDHVILEIAPAASG